jgi:hypothetical protein
LAGPEINIAVALNLGHKNSMLAKVCSAALNGIEAFPVEVEVNAGWGDTLIVIFSCILRIRQRLGIKLLAEVVFANRNFTSDDGNIRALENPGCI